MRTGEGQCLSPGCPLEDEASVVIDADQQAVTRETAQADGVPRASCTSLMPMNSSHDNLPSWFLSKVFKVEATAAGKPAVTWAMTSSVSGASRILQIAANRPSISLPSSAASMKLLPSWSKVAQSFFKSASVKGSNARAPMMSTHTLVPTAATSSFASAGAAAAAAGAAAAAAGAAAACGLALFARAASYCLLNSAATSEFLNRIANVCTLAGFSE
mmetsp:Transcript_16180/g.17964  ORF Transcript_16180/g.17964 Transcript_16180/m.17964 type:complete len:216 (+) Transcript_16180:132-779(+)